MAEPLPKRFGPYVLLKVLGTGSAGVVYLARPTSPRRGIPAPVVIKTLHDQHVDNPDLVQRFKHEAQLAVYVSSDNIAKVYDAGLVGQTLYIAMEFVPGCRLAEVLGEMQKKRRYLPLRDLVDIYLGGLRGLEALHTAKDDRGAPLKIVHRDLSPKNLMVSSRGQMRLVDLGLGKSNIQSWRTQTGTVMGSPGYMSPEQVRGKTTSQQSDIYSMAIILWEMITATPYIKRGALSEILMRSSDPVFRAPSERRRNTPKALDEILRHALQPDRADRTRTVTELRESLEAVLPTLPESESHTVPITSLTPSELDPDEIRDLLRLKAPRASSSQTGAHTVVFAVRSELPAPTEEDLDPTVVHDPSMAETKLRPAPQITAESIILDSINDAPRDDTGITEPGARPAPTPTAVPLEVKRGVPISVVLMLVAMAVSMGLVVGRLTLDEPSPDPPAVVEDAPRAAAPSVPASPTPTPVVTTASVGNDSAHASRKPAPLAAAPTVEPGKPSKPDDTKARPDDTKAKSDDTKTKGRASKRRRPKSADSTARPGASPPVRDADVPALVERLTRRAKKIRRESPDKAAAVDGILTDIAMESMSSDKARAARRLKKLSRALDALAK